MLMKGNSARLVAVRLLLVWFCVVGFCPAATSGAQKTATQTRETLGRERTTALDTYVHAADTNYAFHLVASIPSQGYTAFVLEMTSQAWLTTNEVDRPVWTHWLTIIKPNGATNSTGLLF